MVKFELFISKKSQTDEMVFGPGEAVEPFYWSKLVTRIMVGCWKWIHNNKFLNTVYPWYKISHYSHITGCVILLLLKTLAKDTAEWVGKSYYNGWNKCQWVRSNIFPKREHIAHFLVFFKKKCCVRILRIDYGMLLLECTTLT